MLFYVIASVACWLVLLYFTNCLYNKLRVNQINTDLKLQKILDEEKILEKTINSYEDTFTVVPWPQVQNLMLMDEFSANSCAVDSELLIEKYGSMAYFVRTSWLNSVAPNNT